MLQALARNRTTLAIQSMDLLLGRDGTLEPLRRMGYRVEGPWHGNGSAREREGPGGCHDDDGGEARGPLAGAMQALTDGRYRGRRAQ